MKLARSLPFRGAIGASRHMLFQFIASVVGQLVINVEQNIFLYPFAFHRCTLCLPLLLPSFTRLDSRGRLSPRDRLFIACPPESLAAFAWLGIKCSLRFLRWYSKSRRRSAISIPGSA